MSYIDRSMTQFHCFSVYVLVVIKMNQTQNEEESFVCH